ncbi:MAG TPA: GNAT family N-acetyltransferase [Terriglobales bacterium]|nr:GNAT family N-acetyltransferase [Terriglobales bacterium]
MEIVPHHDSLQADVNSLIIGIQAGEFSIPITLDEQPDLFDIEGFYRQGKGDFWVATDNGKVVGTIALRDIGNHQGALRKMFVHPDYRGKEHGIAHALLKRLLKESKERGFQEIFLGTTEKFRAAQRFYEKNGFEAIAPEELPPAFPRMIQDTKYYRLRLTRNEHLK